VLFGDREMIDQPPAAVKPAYDATHHLTVVFGQQEQVWVPLELFLDFLWLIRAAQVNAGASRGPQLANHRIITWKAKFTYSDRSTHTPGLFYRFELLNQVFRHIRLEQEITRAGGQTFIPQIHA